MSQTDDDETLTLSDPLLIVLANAPMQSLLSINVEISNSYQGEFTIANYFDLKQNPQFYSAYRHILVISIRKANTSEGKFIGTYILKDRVNESNVEWVFFSDDRLPNGRAFFSMLNLAASDPELGYKDIFPEDQTFTSNKPEEIVLDKISSNTESISECLKATFLLSSEIGQGSSFFIDSKHAITNYHVVGSEKTVSGTDHLGNEFELDVIQTDPENDLALLAAKDEYASSYYFHIGTPLDSNIVGKEVFTIGSPASDELINTVSGGIISGLRTFDDREIIQINAPVNPGNSGGPLVDSNGKLLGIVVAKIAGLGTEGIAFAISREQLLESFNLAPQ